MKSTGTDADNDGWTVGDGDCDDHDAATNPDAAEISGDGQDQNCDGTDFKGALPWVGSSTALLGDDLRANFGRSLMGIARASSDGGAALLVGAPNDGGDWGDGGPTSYGQVWVFSRPNHAESLGDAVAVLTSDTQWDGTGDVVGNVGDLDQDGVGEIAVLASRAGTVSVFAGPVTGELNTSNADWTIVGSGLGIAAAGAGDAVWVLGTAWDGGTTPLGPGVAYLMSGVPGTENVKHEAAATIVGLHDQDYAGSIVDMADLNGDGVADILVGAPYAGAGYAALLAGPLPSGEVLVADRATVWSGEADGDEAANVKAIGDWNEDGLEDVAVGAPAARAGRVYVLSGDAALVGSTGKLADAALAIDGEHPGDRFGGYVVGAGPDHEAIALVVSGLRCEYGFERGREAGRYEALDADWVVGDSPTGRSIKPIALMSTDEGPMLFVGGSAIEAGGLVGGWLLDPH